MRIRFVDVGRDKMTWEAECRELTHIWLLKQVLAKRALISRDIEFDDDGNIWVGGVRCVGRFEEVAPVNHGPYDTPMDTQRG